MNFTPLNRHILIEIIDEEEEKNDSLVVLPTDYIKPQSPYLKGKVVDIAEDCRISLNVGDIVVFERRVLHSVKILSETYYLVLENYIYGSYKDEIK